MLSKVLSILTISLILSTSLACSSPPCSCLTSTDCLSLDTPLCDPVMKICSGCVKDADCTHIFAYPFSVSCSSEGTCANCLGGCEQSDLLLRIHQRGDDPRVFDLKFNKDIGLTSLQLSSIINVTLYNVGSAQFNYSITQADSKTYKLVLTLSQELFQGQLEISFKIQSPDPYYSVPIRAILLTKREQLASAMKVIAILISIIGLFCGLYLSITQKTDMMLRIFIDALQLNFFQICYGVDYPSFVVESLKWLSIGRFSFLPGFIKFIFFQNSEPYGLFNFERAGIYQPFLWTQDGLYTFSLIFLLVWAMCEIYSKFSPNAFSRILSFTKKFMKRAYVVMYFELVVVSMQQSLAAKSSTPGDIFLSLFSFFVSNGPLFLNFYFLYNFTQSGQLASVLIKGLKKKEKTAKVTVIVNLIFKHLLAIFLVTCIFDPGTLAILYFIACLGYLAFLFKVRPFKSEAIFFMHILVYSFLSISTFIFIFGMKDSIQDEKKFEFSGLVGILVSFASIGILFLVMIVLMIQDLMKRLSKTKNPSPNSKRKRVMSAGSDSTTAASEGHKNSFFENGDPESAQIKQYRVAKNSLMINLNDEKAFKIRPKLF